MVANYCDVQIWGSRSLCKRGPSQTVTSKSSKLTKLEVKIHKKSDQDDLEGLTELDATVKQEKLRYSQGFCRQNSEESPAKRTVLVQN